jgi:hypothetical protein
MPKILICGSRYATHAMLDMARSVVSRTHYYGGEILVGDADGIDKKVVQTAECIGLSYVAYGIWHKARNGAVSYMNIWPEVSNRVGKQYRGSKYRTKQLYTERDKWMVEQADFVVCIWNGKSTGTKAVYEYARSCGIEAVLKEPKR